MGLIYGDVRHWLEQGDGIDLWGRVMGARDWIGEMGLICGGTRAGASTRFTSTSTSTSTCNMCEYKYKSEYLIIA